MRRIVYQSHGIKHGGIYRMVNLSVAVECTQAGGAVWHTGFPNFQLWIALPPHL